jgi:hypothetical protein
MGHANIRLRKCICAAEITALGYDHSRNDAVAARVVTGVPLPIK